MRTLVIVFLTLLVAVPVLAGAPATGTFSATDGKFSESWGPPYRDGVVGNTLHAIADAGAPEWTLQCASIATIPTTVSDTRDENGIGDVVYSTNYTGGTLWLSGAGPWGDNSQDYTADVSELVVLSTHQYGPTGLIGIRSNVTVQAEIQGFDNCLEYSINNAAIEASTDYMPLPGGYPSFLDPANCPAGSRTQGAWGTATQITIVIYGDCTIPVKDATWGHVKSLYE